MDERRPARYRGPIMTQKPLLVIDAYLDDQRGAGNFLRHLDGSPTKVLRAARDPLEVDLETVRGIAISGSAASVVTHPPSWVGPLLALLRRAFDRRVPVLGVCFGHQAIAEALGAGNVGAATPPEVGWIEVEQTGEDPVLSALPNRFPVFVSHHDSVRPAEGLTFLARSSDCSTHAIRVDGLPVWGVQFHAEMAVEEASAIVERWGRTHPALCPDPEARIAHAIDQRDLFGALLRRFSEHATHPRP